MENLNGFNGVCILTVIFQHFIKFTQTLPNSNDYSIQAIILKIFYAFGTHFGIIGLFLSTAFFHTYHLIIDLDKSQNNRINLLIIAKYTIRRFFRVYLTFAVFWSCYCALPNRVIAFLYKPIETFINGLLLQQPKTSYLWVVAIQIKYYFIIPLIGVAMAKCGKYWPYLTLLFASSIVWIQYRYQSEWNTAVTALLPTLMSGSLIAFLTFKNKGNEILSRYLANKLVRILVNFIMALTIVLLCYHCYSLTKPPYGLKGDLYKSGCFMAIFLVLLINVENNFLENIFNNRYLKSLGEQYYGVYLTHVLVINLLAKTFGDLFGYEIVLLLSAPYSYFIGVVWFYSIERYFIRMANYLCRKLECYQFFYSDLKLEEATHQNMDTKITLCD